MSFLSKLFGGSSGGKSAEAQSIDHKGFQITPAPMREGSKHRLSARIEKEVGGTLKQHTLIRADVMDSYEDAADASIRKAKQMIDEQGERLFS